MNIVLVILKVITEQKLFTFETSDFISIVEQYHFIYLLHFFPGHLAQLTIFTSLSVINRFFNYNLLEVTPFILP